MDTINKYKDYKYDEILKMHNEYAIDDDDYVIVRNHLESLIQRIVDSPTNTTEQFDLYELTIQQLEDKLKTQTGGKRKTKRTNKRKSINKKRKSTRKMRSKSHKVKKRKSKTIRKRK